MSPLEYAVQKCHQQRWPETSGIHIVSHSPSAPTSHNGSAWHVVILPAPDLNLNLETKLSGHAELTRSGEHSSIDQRGMRLGLGPISAGNSGGLVRR